MRLGRGLRVEHELGHAPAVAQVYENNSAVVAARSVLIKNAAQKAISKMTGFDLKVGGISVGIVSPEFEIRDLKLTTPAGWKVEPLEWPVPVRIDAGGGVTYGYENSVELLFRVTPNEKSGWIKAFGDALICQSICQPAKIFAGTEVTVAPRDAESPQSGRLRELADTLPAPSEPGNLRVVRQGDNLVLSGFGDAKIFDFDAVIAPEAPIADGSVKLSPYATLGKSVKFLVVPKQGRARVVTVPVTTS